MNYWKTGTDTIDASDYTGALTVGLNSQGQVADTVTGGTGSSDTLSVTADDKVRVSPLNKISFKVLFD